MKIKQSFTVMKNLMLILLLAFSISFNSYGQKDKEELKAQKAVNKDAAKSAREANKAFKDKDYFTALNEAVDALDGDLKKKNSRTTGEILAQSYGLLEKQALETIAQKEASSSSYSGRTSVTDMQTVVSLYSKMISAQKKLSTLDDATLSDAGIKKSSFPDYQPNYEASTNKFIEFAQKYGEEQYEKGKSELSNGTKKSAYKAFFHFSEVIQFLTDYEDARELRTKAQLDATYKILFVDYGTNFTPPPTSRGTASISENLRGSIEKLKGSPYAPFVKITVEGYSNELYLNINNPSGIDAFCKAKEIDAVIFGSYDTPTFTHVDGKPDSKEIEKEVTVGEKKEIQDGKEVMVPIKQKVKATRTYYSRTNVSKVNGRFNFYDAYQGKYILKDFGMQGEYTYNQNWTMATGDLRVFDEKEQRRFAKEHEPIADKGEMQMYAISELAKKVEAKSLETLKILYEGN